MYVCTYVISVRTHTHTHTYTHTSSCSLQSMPGGFNALARMYTEIQEPMMDVAQETVSIPMCDAHSEYTVFTCIRTYICVYVRTYVYTYICTYVIYNTYQGFNWRGGAVTVCTWICSCICVYWLYPGNHSLLTVGVYSLI